MTEQNIHLLWDEEIDALVLESVLAVLDNMASYQEHQGGRAELSETLELFRSHLLTNGLESIVSNDIKHTDVTNQEELPLFVDDADEDDSVDEFEDMDTLHLDLSALEPGVLEPFDEVDEDEAETEADSENEADSEDEAEEERLAEEIRIAEEEAWRENAERDAEALRLAEEEAWRENAEREAAAAEAAERLAEEIRIAEEEAWAEYAEREDERIRQEEADALAAYEAELEERSKRPSPRSILAHAKSLESE